MAEIERELVKKSFGKYARQYDSLATVQKKVTDRFTELLANSISPPTTLLDIGSGTGRLLEKISLIFPETALFGVDLAFGMTKIARNRLEQNDRASLVCSDAEELPFRDKSFDMVISTSTYQWINPLEKAFTEAYRILKPSGRFLFALFGEKTLFELKESYRNACTDHDRGAADRMHQFATTDKVLSALNDAGFSSSNIHDEMECEIHPDVAALFRSLKGIGAGNAAHSSNKGLSGRNTMLRMMEMYREKYAINGGIQASYHVLYGFGEKR